MKKSSTNFWSAWSKVEVDKRLSVVRANMMIADTAMKSRSADWEVEKKRQFVRSAAESY